MRTLTQTLADQNDLDTLCADRPLRTREKFSANDYYGGAAVLKEYAGIPQKKPLRVIVPHGPSLSETQLWRAERKNKLSRVLCYPSYREKVYWEIGKRPILSAAPFAYAVKQVAIDSSKRKGTLFFPRHSTHHVTVHMDFDKLADMLVSWDEEYQPVTVCIYWRDYNLGYHIPFQERGLRIVSAGHMFDPNFLYRLYHLCSRYKYSSGNGLGSYIFYSVKAGCSYFYTDAEFTCTGDLERSLGVAEEARTSMLKEIFHQRREKMTLDQLNLVDYYLGVRYLKSPKELRKVIL